MATAASAHPTRLGQYRIVREIGRGAMAVVYEGEHTKLGKRVALKALHPHLAVDETAASRFLREGRAAAQIKSAHVVDVFDVGTEDGVPYLVMELLEGQDIAALLHERGRLPLDAIASLMLPILSAVAAAHDAGVIHRDLKPSNLFLARRANGEARPTILDFGISKLEDDVEHDLTRSEVILGTVHYMSPEQTRGARNASVQSDVYALGVMLYELATGKRPFSGASPYALMHAIVSAKVAPPSALVPSLPAAFDDVVLSAMHRDPRARGSVRDLGASLLAWAPEADRRRWAAEFGGAVKTPTHRQRRLRRLLATAGVVALTVSLGALTLVTRGAQRASVGAIPPPRSGALAATPPPLPTSAPTAAPAPTPDPPPTPAASSSPSPARAAPRAVGSATSRVPHAAAKLADGAAEPEHGTNGALILE